MFYYPCHNSLTKSISEVSKFNKISRKAYKELGENKKDILRNQAALNSETVVYLSKKQVCKEGRTIFEGIRKEVSIRYNYDKRDFCTVYYILNVYKLFFPLYS